jgi:uncharacterized membrane protein
MVETAAGPDSAEPGTLPIRHERRLTGLLAVLWASPNTLLGMIFAVPAWIRISGSATWVQGVLEIHGGIATVFLKRVCGLWLSGGAAAMTLGHVVIGVDRAALVCTRAHERVHVRQYEQWGPLFLPAYGFASLVAWLRGRDGYRGNCFEREAYSHAP